MPYSVDEDDERLDLTGVFVVDYQPGLYGPFETRRLAAGWASEQLARSGRVGVTCEVAAVSLEIRHDGNTNPVADPYLKMARMLEQAGLIDAAGVGEQP